MIPLALLGGVIYYAIFDLYLHLQKHSFYRQDLNALGHWIDVPQDAKGVVKDMLVFTQEGVSCSAAARGRFEELRMTHVAPLRRRMQFCNILIGAAPLTGLLGTVMGMLSTFFGLSVSAGGDSIDLVAGGISEALITTEMGLVLAIPAYVTMSFIKKRVGEMEHFFTSVEILTILKFEKQTGKLRRAS